MQKLNNNKLKFIFRIFKYLRPNISLFLSVLFLNSLIVGLTFFSAYLLKPITDKVLIPTATTPAQDRIRMLFLLLLLLLFAYFLRNGLQSLSNFCRSLLAERTSFLIQKDMYTHIQKLPMVYFNESKISRLYAILANEATFIKFFLTNDLLSIFTILITFVGSTVFLFSVNLKLTILLVATIPLITIVTMVLGGKSEKFSRIVFRQSLPYNHSIIFTLGNMLLIKTCGAEKQELNKFNLANNTYYEKKIEREKFDAIVGIIPGIIFNLSTVGIYWVGGLDIIHGTLTLGGFTIFISMLASFQGSLQNFGAIYLMFKNTTPGIVRFCNLMDEKPEFLTDFLPANPWSVVKGEIVFDNITFSYDEKNNVITNFSCTIKPGEIVGLVGPNGTGKSTLLSLLFRLYDVTSGTIYIDGKNIKEMDVRHVRSQMGLVLQETFLLNGTIAENIAYPKTNATIREIIEAAKASTAHDFIVGLPQAYDTLIGDRGIGLSGGEKQRISISRALMNNPKILVFDEPTSNMDLQSEGIVRKTIAQFHGERTILIASHRTSMLEGVNKLLFFNKNGVITIFNNYESFIDKNGYSPFGKTGEQLI